MGGYKPRLLEHEKVITPGEKDQLLSYISTPTMRHTRVATCMNLVLKTGLRVSEVCKLEVEHCLLDIERPMICVWGGKMRSKEEADTVKISKVFAFYLKEWIRRTKPRQFIIEYRRGSLTRNTIWRDFKAVYATIGLSKKYGVHALRHRFITDTYKAFTDPVITMNQARHKNLAVTTRYIHLATEESSDFREKLEMV